MTVLRAKNAHINDAGRMVAFADVPNSGTVVAAKTGQRTGNKAHDSRSGKFARTTGGGKGKQQTANPNVDPAELERMMSAVRDAAREFDVLEEGDIEEFLKARAKDRSVVDLEQFIVMVRRQRVSDLSDLLDQQLRATGSLKQGRRKVSVRAPRGFLRKALRDVKPEEAKIILNSLVSRGHSEEEAKKFLKTKNLGDVQFCDEVEYDDEPDAIVTFAEAVTMLPQAITASMTEAIAAMPVPQITVQIPEPKPRQLSVVRGSNGLIQSVKDD